MARLELLGGATLLDDDGASSPLAARRHPVALLALLAATPSATLSRTKLVGYLWPEVPDDTARNRLATCVHRIRSALGPAILATRGGDLVLDRRALASDVHEFQEAMDAGHHRRAVELYRGPFLDGFALPGSSSFDHWRDREEARLRRSYHAALEALAERAMAEGEVREGVRWWRERAESDPYDSRVAGELVRALAAVGNRAEALRAAADHVGLLRDEFGTEPGPEFRTLVERVRRAAVPSPGGDPEVYRLYIQGRTLLDQRTEHDMYRSVAYFRRALERDPEHALAWAGLADALSVLQYYDHTLPESAPDPLEAARRAVALGPEDGPAHVSLGIQEAVHERGPQALEALLRAVELSPDYAEAFAWLGWLHLLRGRPDEALPAARRAVELDPLAPAFRAYLAETWLAMGEARRALREAARAREIQPEYGLAHFVEGLVLHHLERDGEAAAAFERALALVPPRGSPRHAEIRAALAVVRARSGDREGAARLVESIREAEHPFSTGLAAAALGDREGALAAFETVRRWASFSNEHFRYFFPDVLGPLREEPRYRRILGEIDARWKGGPAE